MKKQNTLLTRAMLEEMGIENIEWDEETNNWKIRRNWFKNNSKTIREIRIIKISEATCKHKYTKDKTYPVVSFYYAGKPFASPLARFVYAWFRGEIKEGQVVDHIDNNPYNNRLSNLQALTPEQNLAKRFIDNPNSCRNQWDAIKREEYNKKIIDKYYVAQSELVNVINKLTDNGPAEAKKSLDIIENIANYIKDTIC